VPTRCRDLPGKSPTLSDPSRRPGQTLAHGDVHAHGENGPRTTRTTPVSAPRIERETSATSAPPSAGGDWRALRGLPAVGPNISGALAGSTPRTRSPGSATPAVEARRSGRYGECGSPLELSGRNVRAARARGEDRRCGPCRGVSPRVPAPTGAHRRWWLDRFTVDEVRAMAGAIWGDSR